MHLYTEKRKVPLASAGFWKISEHKKAFESPILATKIWPSKSSIIVAVEPEPQYNSKKIEHYICRTVWKKAEKNQLEEIYIPSKILHRYHELPSTMLLSRCQSEKNRQRFLATNA